MPVHNWTRVDPGIFHHFHTVWIGQIPTILNQGLLPHGYYALAEQHAGDAIADILTLHSSAPTQPTSVSQRTTGGIALLDAPPRVSRHQILDSLAARRRSVAIRHISNHRLIALVEIVSPANKDRASHIKAFVEKALSALNYGVHLLIIDLFPPGRQDPGGIHGEILAQLSNSLQPYDLPPLKQLTLAAYTAGHQIDAYVEHIAPGDSIPEMPLFLQQDRYINVPLEQTYEQAYIGLPSFYRDVLEGRSQG